MDKLGSGVLSRLCVACVIFAAEHSGIAALQNMALNDIFFFLRSFPRENALRTTEKKENSLRIASLIVWMSMY